ncbi:MAG: hypothetical protein IID32_11755 [Planctomycetes bacterium]|nr:hypothetical protein [Planctomycetota bacterium]
MYSAGLESGQEVRFQLSQVVCPEQDRLIEKITEGLEISGRIVYLSDGGDRKDYYAIVEVAGIATPLIIPVSQLEMSFGEERGSRRP